MVRNIPFTDETACEWSVESQHFSKACHLIEAAALRLVELANEAGDHHASRAALQVGCTALRGNEPLYRALIDLNYRRGDQAAMTAAWKELEGILETLGSGPSQETLELYNCSRPPPAPVEPDRAAVGVHDCRDQEWDTHFGVRHCPWSKSAGKFGRVRGKRGVVAPGVGMRLRPALQPVTKQLRTISTSRGRAAAALCLRTSHGEWEENLR